MLNIALVLKSGGRYTRDWVIRLANQVDTYLDLDHRFVVFTDEPAADFGPRFVVIPLNDGLPGWWSKMEIFRPGLFKERERVLYLDLDTLALGSLNEIAGYDGTFAALADFTRPEVVGTGVMAFRTSPLTATLFQSFTADVADGMLLRTRPALPGDQDYVTAKIGGSVQRLQTLYPEQIVSYKVHGCEEAPITGARLCCFHGDPKPDNEGGWAQAMWEAA